MKIRLTTRFAIFFMVVSMTCSAPFHAFTQNNSVVAEAKATAEMDAEADVNKLLWFGAGVLLSSVALLENGCLVSAAGLAGSYFYPLPPPAERFLGKPPEYVNIYTNTYQSKVGALQARYAGAGCAAGGLIIFGLIQSTFSVGIEATISLNAL